MFKKQLGIKKVLTIKRKNRGIIFGCVQHQRKATKKDGFYNLVFVEFYIYAHTENVHG